MCVAGGQGLPRCRVTGLWHQKHYHLTCRPRDNQHTCTAHSQCHDLSIQFTQEHKAWSLLHTVHILFMFSWANRQGILEVKQLPQRLECVPFSITMNESLIQTFRPGFRVTSCAVFDCLRSCSIEAFHPLSANTFNCPYFYVSLITCSVEWSKFYIHDCTMTIVLVGAKEFWNLKL